MPRPNISAADEYTAPEQTQASAVSWGAIVARAAETAVHTDELYFRDIAQRSINGF